MTPETEAAIRAHAIAEYPRECCGLIAIVRGKERYFPCRNLATDNMQFALSPEDWANAEDQGELIALVHSHPNVAPTPSEGDLVSCEATEVLEWHIVHVFAQDGEVTTGEIVTFRPSGYVAPLVGRSYCYGVLDCYTLIRDWYKQERGIDLPMFSTTYGWWDRGENLYVKNLDENGFEVVWRNGQPLDSWSPEIGDMILMQCRSLDPNHAGVYIGGGMMLHHTANRLSTRDPFGGYWLECAVLVARHRGMK